MNHANNSLEFTDFHRSTVISLPAGARKETLHSLQATLLERVSSRTDHHDFFAEAQKVIEELKNLGFDLWSWGYNGDDKEIWGWDYVAKSNSGELIVEFHFPRKVVVRWGEDESGGRHF